MGFFTGHARYFFKSNKETKPNPLVDTIINKREIAMGNDYVLSVDEKVSILEQIDKLEAEKKIIMDQITEFHQKANEASDKHREVGFEIGRLKNLLFQS